MHVIRMDAYRRMPWRNGGGETTEVAIGPSDATVDDFDWRVSMAHVEVDGPFSSFVGKDRTIMILHGDGLKLSIDDGAPIDLTRHSEPLAFSGDASVRATLLDGPVTDLNVITDRGRCKHAVRRLLVEGRTELAVQAPVALLFCAVGKMQIEMEGGGDTSVIELMAGDALLLEDAPITLRVFTSRSVLVYFIEILESISGS